MTTAQICEALKLKVFATGGGEREVEGVIVGDLLSYILGEAQENWMWVTVQAHLNVAAVAFLKKLPLIVLTSSRPPQADLVARCQEEKITLAVSPLRSYELSCRLFALGVGSGADTGKA